MKPVIMTDVWVVTAFKQAIEKLLCSHSKTVTLCRLCEISTRLATSPGTTLELLLKARLTFLCLSQGGGEHRGPFPGLLLTAEVKGDAVMWGYRQSQFVALGCFHLIAHRAQVKLCNCLRETGICEEVKLRFEMQRCLSVCMYVKSLFIHYSYYFLQIIKNLLKKKCLFSYLILLSLKG